MPGPMRTRDKSVLSARACSATAAPMLEGLSRFDWRFASAKRIKRSRDKDSSFRWVVRLSSSTVGAAH